MQTRNPLLDEFAKLTTSAIGMAQAIIGSGAAVARFETILNQVMPSPRALDVARTALAGQKLRAKSNELLHIRHQMQTYTGILQMALHTITV